MTLRFLCRRATNQVALENIFTHPPKYMVQTCLRNWRMNDGLEKKTRDAPRMVEPGLEQPQIFGEEKDAGARDRPRAQAFGRRGAAEGLCDRTFAAGETPP